MTEVPQRRTHARILGEGDRHALQKRFADFVQAGCPDDAIDERLRSPERIVGDADFKLAVEFDDRGQTMV